MVNNPVHPILRNYLLWLSSSRPLVLHFTRAWDCCQQDAAALADQHGDCKVWKLLANPTSTSLNFPVGNKNEALDSSKQHGDRKIKLLQWTVTLISLHLQWNEGQNHASEDCDCPHRLGCCVSLNVKAHRLKFPHFRPPVTLSTVSWFCFRSRCRPVSSWCRVSFTTRTSSSITSNSKPVKTAVTAS